MANVSDGALLTELRQLHRSEVASNALRARVLLRVASLPAPEPLRWAPLAAAVLAAAAVGALLLLAPGRKPRAEPALSPVAVSPAAVPARELTPAGPAEATGAASREPCPLSQVPPGALYDPGFVAFGAASQGLELRTFEMLVPGCRALTRRYFLYQPSAVPAASRAPLIIVLHDSGDSAEGLRALQSQQSFEALADRERLLVVYANAGPGPATGRFPNSGGWQTDPGANRALADEAYLARIWTDLRERQVIEGANDVYLVGYGGGGVMALEAAARHPELYDGVAALLPPRVSPLRPATHQPNARLSRVLFVTLKSERPDDDWPGKPLDVALLEDWALAVGLPLTDQGISERRGLRPPARAISLPGRTEEVQQFEFATPARRGAAVRILVVPRGDELGVGADGSAAPLDAAVQAWEFLHDIGAHSP